MRSGLCLCHRQEQEEQILLEFWHEHLATGGLSSEFGRNIKSGLELLHLLGLLHPVADC